MPYGHSPGMNALWAFTAPYQGDFEGFEKDTVIYKEAGFRQKGLKKTKLLIGPFKTEHAAMFGADVKGISINNERCYRIWNFGHNLFPSPCFLF